MEAAEIDHRINENRVRVVNLGNRAEKTRKEQELQNQELMAFLARKGAEAKYQSSKASSLIQKGDCYLEYEVPMMYNRPKNVEKMPGGIQEQTRVDLSEKVVKVSTELEPRKSRLSQNSSIMITDRSRKEKSQLSMA
jgi:hypothetical protein